MPEWQPLKWQYRNRELIPVQKRGRRRILVTELHYQMLATLAAWREELWEEGADAVWYYVTDDSSGSEEDANEDLSI